MSHNFVEGMKLGFAAFDFCEAFTEDVFVPGGGGLITFGEAVLPLFEKLYSFFSREIQDFLAEF